jgi:peptidoglycan/xylan/chitin deacetylase (PgdA/CDA1 family)/SAM-dependent methyltransferase
VAANIFRAVSIGRGEAPSAWISIVGTVAERLDQFLQAIEERWKIAGLQREAWTTLEQLILDESPASLPTVVGRTYGLEVDVVDPIDDLSLPPGVERLRCTLLYAGTRLGPLHLPAFEGHVPGYVLKDAIVAEYAWPILRRYLQEALRPVLEVRTADGVTSIWRCGIQLATMRGQCAEAYSTEAHSQAGWMLFLQELWGMPSWTMDLFYSPTALEQQGHSVYTRDSWLEVEVSGPLPDVICQAPRLNVVVLVGGVPVGSLVTTLDKGRLRAPALRATINREVGFELCRAAVREGVLGQPVGGPGLRDRLAAAFARASAARVPTWFGLLPDNINAAPGWAVLAARALGTKARGALIARRPGPINSSLSRRAALPPQLASAIFEAAVIGGEPVIGEPHPPEPPVQILYAPELVWHTRGDGPTVTSDGAVPGRDSLNAARSQGRYSFERVFARDRDPWHYTSAYEQTKYEQTLNLLPPGSIGRALEVGCAEGHFTLQLAPRVASLVAADISSIALQRAATRCARHNNVHFVRLDLVTDQLPGPFDLVVCSELLYYVGDREDLKAAVRKLAEALTPGGYLLHAHAHLLVDDPDRTGFDWNMPFGARAIGEVMKDTQSLRLAKELRTPLYRIQLFRHGTPDSPAQVTEFNRQPTTLLPEVEAHVQWDGGTVAKSHQHPDSTDWLPILMYHQVAPSEAGVDDRYRLAPDVFEQQLAFLRGSGYYSVTLQGWRHAMAMHSPLPGRAILLTFDDGYRDFLTYAWPLLKRYGFSAQVFLVPDEIGGYNRWDRDVRRMAPLLDWNEIRGLQREGVTFGSHTASHPRLTALAPIETVQELVRSRATLSQKLGAPVDALAYPYGAADAVVQHLAGAVGYTFGLTCRRARSGLWESPMAMPRLEVRADDTFATFVSTLGV